MFTNQSAFVAAECVQCWFEFFSVALADLLFKGGGPDAVSTQCRNSFIMNHRQPLVSRALHASICVCVCVGDNHDCFMIVA